MNVAQEQETRACCWPHRLSARARGRGGAAGAWASGTRAPWSARTAPRVPAGSGAWRRKGPVARLRFANKTGRETCPRSPLPPRLMQALVLPWNQRPWLKKSSEIISSSSALAFIIQHLTHCPGSKYLITRQLEVGSLPAGPASGGQGGGRRREAAGTQGHCAAWS